MTAGSSVRGGNDNLRACVRPGWGPARCSHSEIPAGPALGQYAFCCKHAPHVGGGDTTGTHPLVCPPYAENFAPSGRRGSAAFAIPDKPPSARARNRVPGAVQPVLFAWARGSPREERPRLRIRPPMTSRVVAGRLEESRSRQDGHLPRKRLSRAWAGATLADVLPACMRHVVLFRPTATGDDATAAVFATRLGGGS